MKALILSMLICEVKNMSWFKFSCSANLLILLGRVKKVSFLYFKHYDLAIYAVNVFENFIMYSPSILR